MRGAAGAAQGATSGTSSEAGPQSAGPSQEETTRGGSTMTSARPVDPYSQDGQTGQTYHPPQAYPAPPGGAPSVGHQGGGGGTSGGGTLGGGTSGGGVRRPRTGARTVPRTRKARLRVAKADPWSVMKVSFLLSIAVGICTIIAVWVLWMVMDAMGVFSSIGDVIIEATGAEDGSGFDLEAFLSLPRVLMFTTLIAVIDVVLATALATLGAFIYNLSAGFVGGVEVTLAEDE